MKMPSYSGLISDWDLDRIYIARHGVEYNIRLWNITVSKIDMTLYKIVGDYGEDVKSGIFYR